MSLPAQTVLMLWNQSRAQNMLLFAIWRDPPSAGTFPKDAPEVGIPHGHGTTGACRLIKGFFRFKKGIATLRPRAGWEPKLKFNCIPQLNNWREIDLRIAVCLWRHYSEMGAVLGLDIVQGGSSKDKELFPQEKCEGIPFHSSFLSGNSFSSSIFIYVYMHSCTYPHKSRQKLESQRLKSGYNQVNYLQSCNFPYKTPKCFISKYSLSFPSTKSFID